MGKILLTCILLTASLIGCQDNKQNENTHPEGLIGAWLHSHEDDTEEIKVYRPAGYDFPPSRGRVGFNLMEGGECIYYGIAPADGSTNEPASWRWEGGNTLVITPKEEGASEMVLEVVSVGEGMLKVKK